MWQGCTPKPRLTWTGLAKVSLGPERPGFQSLRQRDRIPHRRDQHGQPANSASNQSHHDVAYRRSSAVAMMKKPKTKKATPIRIRVVTGLRA